MSYRIVVGVDGSPRSNAALRWSLATAEARGGEVIAVFAWQVPFTSFPGAFDRAGHVVTAFALTALVAVPAGLAVAAGLWAWRGPDRERDASPSAR